MKTQITLPAPVPFDFTASAYSHGWAVLAPNAWDTERRTIGRAEQLPGGEVVLLEVGEQKRAGTPAVEILVKHTGELTSADRADIATKIAHMLRFDEDFSEFYALCAARGGPWTRLIQGQGRLLRSPTLFEDVVKTICTTNIQWGGTKRMLSDLVAAYGAPYAEEPARRAFPRPEAIAAVPLELFAESVRMGYRAPYVHELATKAATGVLDLEALQKSDMPTPELKKELLRIKGVGNYAAATLLMLLGRYDELAVDTIFRDFVSKKYFGGEYPPNGEAEQIYADWGRWKYLAYWFDIWEGLDEEL